MNRKLKLFIFINTVLISNIFDSNLLIAAQAHPVYKEGSSLQVKHPSLRVAVDQLKKIPESNQVIERALKEGSITMEMTYHGMPFAAMWDSTDRKIVIDGRAIKDHGKLLCHLLFELTNALSESKYQELYRMAENGHISCDRYVEVIEKIEYDNMILTRNIVEKGIATGLFPSSARWTVIDDFSIHYKIQQLAGHSLLIADEYQEIAQKKGSSYQGTVKNLRRMSEKEKTSLAGLLYSEYFRTKSKERTPLVET